MMEYKTEVDQIITKKILKDKELQSKNLSENTKLVNKVLIYEQQKEGSFEQDK